MVRASKLCSWFFIFKCPAMSCSQSLMSLIITCQRTDFHRFSRPWICSPLNRSTLGTRSNNPQIPLPVSRIILIVSNHLSNAPLWLICSKNSELFLPIIKDPPNPSKPWFTGGPLHGPIYQVIVNGTGSINVLPSQRPVVHNSNFVLHKVNQFVDALDVRHIAHGAKNASPLGPLQPCWRPYHKNLDAFGCAVSRFNSPQSDVDARHVQNSSTLLQYNFPSDIGMNQNILHI